MGVWLSLAPGLIASHRRSFGRRRRGSCGRAFPARWGAGAALCAHETHERALCTTLASLAEKFHRGELCDTAKFRGGVGCDEAMMHLGVRINESYLRRLRPDEKKMEKRGAPRWHDGAAETHDVAAYAARVCAARAARK